MASQSSTEPNFQPNEELGLYCRIAKLLLSVGTHTLLSLFVHIVGDVGTHLQKQHIQRKLKSAKCISPFQWKIISPPGATPDVGEFDISLLSALLLNVCNLSDGHKTYIKEIRKHRNDLCHSHDAFVTKADFETKWKNVFSTLSKIAQLCGPDFQDKIEKEISDLKTAPIDVSREQRYFHNMLEHCLSDMEFQQDILTHQTEVNRKLNNIIDRMRMLEQLPGAREMIDKLNEINSALKNCDQSNEDKSVIYTLLVEDINKLLNDNFSPMRRDLQCMSQRVTDSMQEQGQQLNRMDKKLDQLIHSKPEVSLIDGALVDKITDGMKKIPAKIVQTFTPIKPTQKADERKHSGCEDQNLKKQSRDDQVKLDYKIAFDFQTSFSRTESVNSKDSKIGNKETTLKHDPEMSEECRMELEKGVSLGLARGVGPDTVLLLDVSCNMKRDGHFQNMMSLTRQIINGIVEESVPEVLEENIAIVTFGRLTTVRMHLTNDQYSWMTCLDDIEGNGPDGSSDLCKGLRMCEAAIQVNKKPLEKHGLCITPRLILITDGNISDPADASETFQNRENARQQACSLMDSMNRKSHKVFCVPLCSPASPPYRFLEKLAHRASGRVIRSDEIQYLTRYHRKILWALLFERCHPGIEISDNSFISDTLKQSKRPFTDDEIEDMKEIIDNRNSLGYPRSGSKSDRYKETFTDLPPLGTRVVQGEHWREDVFRDHHCGPGTGTVIGQDDGRVWVEWDGCEDNTHYKYKFGHKGFYEVMVHDRPRTPEDGKTFLVGCCITRIEWDEDELEDPRGYGLIFISSPRFKTFGARWKNGSTFYNKYSSCFCPQEELPSAWCFGQKHV